MKPLFLSMAIVGAITLWYSNAHAHESGHSSGGKPWNQQVRHPAHHAAHGYNERHDADRRQYQH